LLLLPLPLPLPLLLLLLQAAAAILPMDLLDAAAELGGLPGVPAVPDARPYLRVASTLVAVTRSFCLPLPFFFASLLESVFEAKLAERTSTSPPAAPPPSAPAPPLPLPLPRRDGAGLR
jgi:hypothetical protein